LGRVPCFGQPCQKQPSTKTQSRAALKTKSGLPITFCRRRHPVIRWFLKTSINLISVVLFPCERIRLITSERLRLFQMSDIRSSFAP
jgi:hypothetical protein